MMVADALTEQDRGTITDSITAWAAALNHGSLEGVMAHNAADVLVFPAHEPPISAAGMAYPGVDDQQFATNVMRWLAGVLR